MSSEEASARPERIGKYRIVGTLGQGAMGRVYLGEDPHIGRKVAVKVLAGATGEEARTRFLEEARTIGHLSHPEIVTLLEFGFHEGQPFLVMEHLEGVSFGRWLAQAPTERRVLQALQALCRAVAYAHGQGVLHRDVKPSNLQVLADGRAKLLDFGIARSGSVALTATGMLMGTPQYLAPEVLEGKGHSRASDVYAVGLVAYEALAGLSPFAADTLEQCLKRVLIETPKPLAELRPDLSRELSDAVTASMAKSPEARPTGVEPLLEAIGHALETAPEALDRPTVRLSQEAVRQAGEPPRRRRRMLPIAAAGAALAAVAVAGWLALSSGQAGGTDPEPVAFSSPGKPFEEEVGSEPTRSTTGPGAEVGEEAPDGPGSTLEAETGMVEGSGSTDGGTTPTAGPPGDTRAIPDDRRAESSPPNRGVTGQQANRPDRSPAAPTTVLPPETMRQETAPPEEPRPTEDRVTTPGTTPPDLEPASPNPESEASSDATEAALEPLATGAPSEPVQRVQGNGSTGDPNAGRPQEARATEPAQTREQELPPTPALARIDPSVIRRGALLTLEIEGSGFDDATRVEVRRGSIPMPGIEVRRVRLRDTERLRVTLYVAPDVPLGLYSLVALDADGGPSNSLGLEVSL